MDDGEVDWSLGEALAIGTLLASGANVRLVGQDTRRGTFSHRHAALIDYDNGEQYVPLCNLGEGSGFFTVRDSFLSEYAALGFEYGYSVESSEHPGRLGGAVRRLRERRRDHHRQLPRRRRGQVGPARLLVMLLPHGYEGQGPEHSSGRLERFLSLSARNNLRVAQPTTAAQYFHLLRAQVMRPRVVAPHRLHAQVHAARASTRARRWPTSNRGPFRSVLDDTGADPSAVTRLVLATGKVAHEALAHRDEIGATVGRGRARGAALPLAPDEAVDALLASYPNAQEIVWLQEEPENMGAWPFVHHQLHRSSAASTFATWRARSRPVRRRAAVWCTPPSRPTSWRRAFG